MEEVFVRPIAVRDMLDTELFDLSRECTTEMERRLFSSKSGRS
jgi:hypothetical protein